MSLNIITQKAKNNKIAAFSSNTIAAPEYIKDYGHFPAYSYNTVSYQKNGRFVGCGPTTGVIIFGYFQHANNIPPISGLLTDPKAGATEGLGTAWALHGSQYMATAANGFGSYYSIEPGLENYTKDMGFNVKMMIHEAASYNPNSYLSVIKN